MGEKKINSEIVFAEDLVKEHLFNSIETVYQTPDSVLPRVRRNGIIVRPLRFYRSDVERLFSKPLAAYDDYPTARSLTIETTREPLKIARPSIQFKKRRR